MSIPDDATLTALADEFADLGFTTGTAAQNIAALSVAWELAEYGIGTNLLTGTVCEEHNWPTGRWDAHVAFPMVQLRKTRLITLDSVTVHHELYDCECGTQEVTGCATIYHHDRSEVALQNCFAGGCVCNRRPHEFKAEICYTAGLYNNIGDMEQSVKTALALLFSWWFNLLATGGADAGSGVVTAWKSMDYSEEFGNIGKNLIGTSPQAAAAWLLLRRFRIVRAVAMRSYYPSHTMRW